MTLALGDIDLYANNPQRLFVGVSVGNPNFQDIGVASILSTSTITLLTQNILNQYKTNTYTYDTNLLYLSTCSLK
jgi:hypothetical protein